MTWKGRQDNQTLIQSCKPDCSPASVHHIRMVYLAADVSMGVGLVALVASAWLYLRSGHSEEKASAQTPSIGMLNVQPALSGAIATIGGAF